MCGVCAVQVLLHEGQVVYAGVASEALDHFAALGHTCPPHHNPAGMQRHTVHLRELSCTLNGLHGGFDYFAAQLSSEKQLGPGT